MNYPKMKKQDFSYTMAGHTIKDEYILLENPKLEETMNWVKDENEVTDHYFQAHLNHEVSELIEKYRNKQDNPEFSTIIPMQERLSATRMNSDGTYSIVTMKQDFSDVQEIDLLIDDSFTIFSMIPSGADNDLVYLRGLKDGAGRPSVFIYHLKTKEFIQQLDGIFYSLWDKTGTKVIYSDATVDKEKGMNTNYIRIFDCLTGSIKTLYETCVNTVLIAVAGSSDGQVIMGSVNEDYANSILVAIDADSEEVTLLNEKAMPIQYCDSTSTHHLFINYEEAPFGEIIAIEKGKKFADRQVLVAASDKILDQVIVKGDELFVMSMKDACSHIELYNLNGNFVEKIKLPSEYGTCTLASGNMTMKHDQSQCYFSFESFTDAPMILQLENHELKPVYMTSEAKYDEIEVIQKKVEVRDGTFVPAFIVYKKGTEKNGNNPTLMYAYGGYNNAMPPSFSNPFVGMDIVDWVMDGGVYVNINIRGGNEYGTAWHDGGCLANKKNCFTDFIDVTEALIQEGWTNPKKIGICGGSNGGLLMCALLTMRPDLWGCVIASVPHTDMLRFCLDDRGPMYITEYGNPQEEGMFEIMKSYSPYHNIQEVAYPPIYIQTGECDNNVPPYHGKKMAARLQELNQSANPILLRVLAKGSHDRGKGEVHYKTIAEMQSFLKAYLMNK